MAENHTKVPRQLMTFTPLSVTMSRLVLVVGESLKVLLKGAQLMQDTLLFPGMGLGNVGRQTVSFEIICGSNVRCFVRNLSLS